MAWTQQDQDELQAHADLHGAAIKARLEFHTDGAITVHARRGGDNPLQFGRLFTPANLAHAKRGIEAKLAEARAQFDSALAGSCFPARAETVRRRPGHFLTRRGRDSTTLARSWFLGRRSKR
jgi:hypothetical protein